MEVKPSTPDMKRNRLNNIKPRYMKSNAKRKKCNIDSDEIGMIAACLSDNYLTILYDFCNGRNLFGYIGCLSEISDWSHEFYREYYEKMTKWENFEESEENIYNAVGWD